LSPVNDVANSGTGLYRNVFRFLTREHTCSNFSFFPPFCFLIRIGSTHATVFDAIVENAVRRKVAADCCKQVIGAKNRLGGILRGELNENDGVRGECEDLIEHMAVGRSNKFDQVQVPMMEAKLLAKCFVPIALKLRGAADEYHILGIGMQSKRKIQ
jgi:hypothetical protein